MARRQTTGPGGRRASSFRAPQRRERTATRRPARDRAGADRTGTDRTRPASGARSSSGAGLTARAQLKQRSGNAMRSPMTRQILALGIALSVVALSLAYPLRNYVEQQAVERDATAAQATLEREVADLEAQIAALEDPAYIKAEAKRRLQYVTPGDQVYVVQLPPGLLEEPTAADKESTTGTSAHDTAVRATETTADADSSSGASAASASSASDATGDEAADSMAPWYQSLWETLIDD